jgi:hypothetical protein
MESKQVVMTPPRVACRLLEAALPVGIGEAVAGDLCEEFVEHVAPARGERAARWWFRWQVARSLAPLFFRSWQRASAVRASAAIVIAGAVATVPAALLLSLRSFVLQQVPLKTTAEMSPAFAVGLTLLVVSLAAAGALAGGRLIQVR